MLLLNCQIVGEMKCWITRKGLYCVPATKHRGLFTLFPKRWFTTICLSSNGQKKSLRNTVQSVRSTEAVHHGGRSHSSEENTKKNGPVRSACSCPSSLVYACLMSASYALGVKLLMWAITVILCLDKSPCMQLGVWLIIISTHYVWLAPIKKEKR